MAMYNLVEYSWNYSEKTVSLWFYSKDEAANFILPMITLLNLPVIMLNHQKILKLIEQIELLRKQQVLCHYNI